MRILPVLIVIICALLAVPALAQDELPYVEPTECPITSEYFVEGETWECGFLYVPENRSNPDSQTIRLMYAIVSAWSGESEADPVVYLAGGPGGGAVADVDGWAEIAYLENRDLILVDQRGTGYSQPTLDCPEDEDGEDNPVTRCHERLVAEGIDLAAYNSAESAADFEDLRVALGYDEWNLYGISYGTRLGLTIMRDHPDGLRSVILDSVYPPHVYAWEEYGVNTMDAFRIFFEGCAFDTTCSEAFPDLETTFYETVERLNNEPVTYLRIDSITGAESEDELSGSGLIDTVFEQMYSSEAIPYLPWMINEVANGNYDAINFVQRGITEGFGGKQDVDVSNSEGMRYSVECYEELAFNDYDTALASVPDEPALLAESSRQFIEDWFNYCSIWDVGSADPLENDPVESDLPTFVINGEYDPITPAHWAESTAGYLSNSYLFIIPGGGHSALDSNECATELAVAFLDDPSAELDLTCYEELTGPEFVTEP